jgi:hypothetical protein
MTGSSRRTQQVARRTLGRWAPFASPDDIEWVASRRTKDRLDSDASAYERQPCGPLHRRDGAVRVRALRPPR